MKHNFKNGDRVVICNIGDGKEYNGTICGKVFEHIVDTYIVKPDNSPFNNTYKYDCVALAESCLRPLQTKQHELNENTISVWKYEDAPKEYKELSRQGDKCTWVALVPNTVLDHYYISWIHSTEFADCHVEQYNIDQKNTVYIGINIKSE